MRRLGPHIDGHAVEEIATVTRAGVDEVDRAAPCRSPIQLVW